MKRFNLHLLGLFAAALLLQSCSDNSAGPNNTGTGLGGGTTTESIKIVYLTGDDMAVALMNPDGSEPRQIVDAGINPVVSPDGKHVAFDLDVALYVVNIDGASRRMLAASGSHPSWSPDGTKLVYASPESGSSDIWVINADGTGKRRLTTSSSSEHHAQWSPDGNMISFLSNVDTDERRIYVMNADGTSQRRITTNNYRNSDFHRSRFWSSDSRRIVYTGTAGSRTQVFVVNADGSSQTQVTNVGGGGASDPCWSPDGSSIA